jgi:hypothetical protein
MGHRNHAWDFDGVLNLNKVDVSLLEAELRARYCRSESEFSEFVIRSGRF